MHSVAWRSGRRVNQSGVWASGCGDHPVRQRQGNFGALVKKSRCGNRRHTTSSCSPNSLNRRKQRQRRDRGWQCVSMVQCKTGAAPRVSCSSPDPPAEVNTRHFNLWPPKEIVSCQAGTRLADGEHEIRRPCLPQDRRFRTPRFVCTRFVEIRPPTCVRAMHQTNPRLLCTRTGENRENARICAEMQIKTGDETAPQRPPRRRCERGDNLSNALAGHDLSPRKVTLHEWSGKRKNC
jgi:hypothetical protein